MSTPKTAQDNFKMFPRTPTDCPRLTQVRPRWPQVGQDGPKMAPRWSKMAQDGPKMAPLSPKINLYEHGNGKRAKSGALGSELLALGS